MKTAPPTVTLDEIVGAVSECSKVLLCGSGASAGSYRLYMHTVMEQHMPRPGAWHPKTTFTVEQKGRVLIDSTRIHIAVMMYNGYVEKGA